MNELTTTSNNVYMLNPNSKQTHFDDESQPHVLSDINPFINAANPLLILMIQIKHCNTKPDISKLHQQIVNELQLFEKKIRHLNYPERAVMAARYCLCTAIDESVLRTSWGTKTMWLQHSLLNLFHNESFGGERFYTIVENMAQQPRDNLALLELLYLLLSLGFEGKFYDQDQVIREEVRNRLLQRIRRTRGKTLGKLSTNVQDLIALQNKIHKKSSLRWILIAAASLLLVVNITYNIKLHYHAKATIELLNKSGNESPITAYSQLISRPIINRDSRTSQ